MDAARYQHYSFVAQNAGLERVVMQVTRLTYFLTHITRFRLVVDHINRLLGRRTGRRLSAHKCKRQSGSPEKNPPCIHRTCYLWPPYGIGQAIIFLPCGFFLSFFPGLISAAADRMSTILPHMVWP